MADTILPFSLDRSTEKLTDCGSLAAVDAYAGADWSAREGRPGISGAGFKPIGWKHRTIQMIRREALRLVGKVTKSARQLTCRFGPHFLRSSVSKRCGARSTSRPDRCGSGGGPAAPTPRGLRNAKVG